MKKLIIALCLTISSISFADDCSQEALKVAKSNLDQVANSYGFESADIDENSSNIPVTTIDGKYGELLTVHTVYGYVYKAGYVVEVTLDSLCAIRNVSIQEDL